MKLKIKEIFARVIIGIFMASSITFLWFLLDKVIGTRTSSYEDFWFGAAIAVMSLLWIQDEKQE